MSEQQPPTGYVSEPPTKPGWYRVWSLEEFWPPAQKVAKAAGWYGVFRLMNYDGEIIVILDDDQTTAEDMIEKGFFFGPKVEF